MFKVSVYMQQKGVIKLLRVISSVYTQIYILIYVYTKI